MIRYESVYVYFIATKNVGDYSYMSSPNIYYRALFMGSVSSYVTSHSTCPVLIVK
ncbi:universal stress protein [Veillonella sp. CNR 79/14]|uniref:universal stress protein n=1 Tax=Veillonella sp. CNR 79/14 TaxID=2490954 RepID=UPI00352EAB42